MKTSKEEMVDGLKEKLKACNERKKKMVKCSKCKEDAKYYNPGMNLRYCETHMPDEFRRFIKK